MIAQDSWTVSSVPSIHKVDPAEWDRVAGGRGLYVSHPWLTATEEAAENRGATEYLLVHQGPELRAAMALYPRTRPPEDRFYDVISQFAEPSGCEDREGWYPSVLGGTIAAYWNDLLVDRTAPPQARDTAMKLLLEAFDRARAGRAAALRYLTAEAAEAAGAHFGERAQVFFSGGAQTTIDVQWSSFEDYLSWLPGRRRIEAGREIRKFHAWEADLTSPGFGDRIGELAPLVAQLKSNYGHAADESTISDQLHAQEKYLGDRAKVFASELSGRVVAFSLSFVWENELYVRSVGFDYARTERTFAYFNLTYYEPIRFAIENGLRRVHLGLGTYEAKQARGARLEPSWCVVFPPAGTGVRARDALERQAATGLRRWEERYGPIPAVIR
ncbi:GNAT family N-acetyltransferase [Nonomuraea cavernae]|uniref:BioF2-like acetyltransferase domain-containing protein n=1 Tax=Nonomuraea cavernae TaxID=2045107 RepID=A0A917YN25_9ACTN|nr:GNAT family N-acetyltransferase [Nonomuraea cavernae]MCA2183593.1 GNAT family N-acetyltransferase [Nonomuraea cavernae]GGO60769.1 hypothetical protein GCM10012289_01420 [Nonomuraea cavernae]